MSGARRAGWPVGLIGMLGLIAAVEFTVSRRMDLLMPPLVMDWRAARSAAAREAKGCDVLCFGSSLVKAGVLPAAIERGTGLRGYNLSLPGGPPASAYFMLRRALDHGARPSAVVVDFHHQRLKDDPCAGPTVAPWSQVLGLSEAYELARRQDDPTFTSRLLAACLLPTLRARPEARAAVVAALADRPVSQRGPAAAYARNRRRNRGTVVNAKAPGFRHLTVAPEIADASSTWYCHPVNAYFLRRFLDLADARGLAVYWLMPPLSPNLQTTIDRSRGEETFLRMVRRQVERYPRLKVVDARHSGFPATDFIDAVHLDRTGASSLSRSLAAALGPDPARPRAPRWVELPPGPRTVDDPGLEDVFQSGWALSAGAGRLRR